MSIIVEYCTIISNKCMGKNLIHLFGVDIHPNRSLQFKYHACPTVLNHALLIQHHAMFRLDSNADV